ncbi:MAG: hypothetical protein ACK4G3_07125, partial [bacterium]
LLTLFIVFIFYNATGISQNFSTRKEVGLSLLAGFLAVMALGPLIIFLLITIVGAPLILLVLALYIGGLLFGWAVMCRKVGNWFFSLLHLQVPDLLDTFIGFILLSLLVAIPWMGLFFLFFFCILSLGIFTRYLWMVIKRKPAPISQAMG